MRRGVALLLTLVIVMLMAIAIGWSMRTFSKAKETIEKERFMIQGGMIVEDVLGILKKSPEINAVANENNSIALFTLLSSASMLPFESQGYRVVISLTSARAKLNINTFKANNSLRTKQRRERLANFLVGHGLGSDLYDYILDAMGGIKEDNSYRSDLFYNDPQLYRDAIVSWKQMERILLDYAKKDERDPFSKLDFDKIFFYDKAEEVKLDLNYATPEVWEFITGVSKERAKQLFESAGNYKSVEDLKLRSKEQQMLSLFDYSFFEPIILVHIDMLQEKRAGVIEFEYDIKKKKARRFVFEIQN